jgi:hypothetical protein
MCVMYFPFIRNLLLFYPRTGQVGRASGSLGSQYRVSENCSSKLTSTVIDG